LKLSIEVCTGNSPWYDPGLVGDPSSSITDPCRPDLSATKIFKLFGGTAIEELDYNQQIISQQAQITSNQANLFGIENATYVQLLVSNRWGDTRVFEYADPMGLHNVASAPLPSKKSFTLLWPGLWHNNDPALTGAYSYKLTVKSCNFNRVYHGSIAYLAYPRDDDFLTDYDPYINYSPPVSFNIKLLSKWQFNYQL